MAANDFVNLTFGPVPSRRLGRSLGINNIPPKICSYACVYCQLGKTKKMQIERQSFYSPETIFQSVQAKVKQVLSRGETIDYLAIVPDGEPTLDENIGELITLLKSIDIPVAVISNASLISDQRVRTDLSGADWVSLKIDAVDEQVWRGIDRPHGRLSLHQIMEGMLAFRKEFRGILATETMMVKGMNDTESCARETDRFLSRLQPDIVYLSIPTRPPAEKKVQPASPHAVNLAYQIISDNVKKIEILTGYEGNAFSFTGDVQSDILSITAVHPMRHDAVIEILNKAESGWNLVEKMLQDGEIIQSEFNGNTFYMRSF